MFLPCLQTLRVPCPLGVWSRCGGCASDCRSLSGGWTCFRSCKAQPGRSGRAGQRMKLFDMQELRFDSRFSAINWRLVDRATLSNQAPCAHFNVHIDWLGWFQTGLQKQSRWRLASRRHRGRTNGRHVRIVAGRDAEDGKGLYGSTPARMRSTLRL